MRKINITKKLILETARKYTSVTEFYNKSPTIYKGSKNYGEEFYKRAISHMLYKKIPKYKLLKIAKKYNSVKDFKDNDNYHYNNTRRWGKEFYKKALSHMQLHNIKWTKEKVIADAKKYKRKMDWAKMSSSAYGASYKLKINKLASMHFEKVGSHVERCIYSISVQNKKIIYIGLTYDYQRRMHNHKESLRVKKLEKKYGKDKVIFKKLTKYLPLESAIRLEAAYLTKFKNKNYVILNKIQTGGVGNSPSKWTNEKIIEESKKYNSIGEWHRKDKTTLGIAYKRRLIEKCKLHMTNLHRKAFWWKSKKAVIENARKFKLVKDWRKKETAAYKFSKEKGFFDEATKHMEKVKRRYVYKKPLNRVYKKWIKADLLKEAKKYKSRTEWQNKSNGSYKRAHKLGIINVIKPKRAKVDWTEALLRKDAKKYSSRSEWNIKSNSAYRFALKKGLLKKIFPKTFGYGNRIYD